MSSDPVDEDNIVLPLSRAMPNHYKNVSITLLLSALPGLFGFNGIGHIYVGKTDLGVVLLFCSIVIYYLGVLITILFALIKLDGMNAFGLSIAAVMGYAVLFIWQIMHSRKLCKRYNEYYRKNNRSPL